MRTTLTIDDDVLAAAKAIAQHRRRPLGAIVSELARKALRGPTEEIEYRNGIPLLPKRSGVVITTEMINALRDELP